MRTKTKQQNDKFSKPDLCLPTAPELLTALVVTLTLIGSVKCIQTATTYIQKHASQKVANIINYATNFTHTKDKP